MYPTENPMTLVNYSKTSGIYHLFEICSDLLRARVRVGLISLVPGLGLELVPFVSYTV